MKAIASSLEFFIDELFKNETGFVYSPTKEPRWKQYFFQWPDQRKELLEHIRNPMKREVYIGPALFTEPKIHPNNFKGTYHLWTEFDGRIPANLEDSLQPTIRIQSSLEGREHWYWSLDKFETDVNKITDITKRLAYHLDADLSAWDFAQVLRPPETTNQKRKQYVNLKQVNQVEYSIDSFLEYQLRRYRLKHILTIRSYLNYRPCFLSTRGLMQLSTS